MVLEASARLRMPPRASRVLMSVPAKSFVDFKRCTLGLICVCNVVLLFWRIR